MSRGAQRLFGRSEQASVPLSSVKQRREQRQAREQQERRNPSSLFSDWGFLKTRPFEEKRGREREKRRGGVESGGRSHQQEVDGGPGQVGATGAEGLCLAVNALASKCRAANW